MPLSHPPTASISADEAARVAVHAQGLTAAVVGSDPSALLARISAVQLDTIAVLARSHELVPYARLGAIGRRAVERTYWGQHPATAFEYLGHGACLMPSALWPALAFRRREKRARASDALRNHPALGHVRAQLAEGPVTVTDLGGARRSADWFDWSDAKSMAEWLWATGEAVCTDRQQWKRVYDLPERVFAGNLLRAELSDDECHDALVQAAVRALGVATRQDIADYFWLRLRSVDAALRRSDLLPARVEGWPEVAWATASALETAAEPPERTTLLSPFDSLIWSRERMKRLFGVVVLLEAYRPKAQRVHGYFAMPVLAHGRIVGRVDPARAGTTLVVKQASLEEPDAVDDLAAAVREAASWVGCVEVAVERTQPAGLAARLRRALRS
jgi:uncharacterized protein YcaQ